MTKNKFSFYILFLVLLTVQTSVYGQSGKYTSDSKKAVSFFIKAQTHFYQKDYMECLKDISKSLRYDEDFNEALMLRGETYETLEDYDLALDSYIRVYKNDTSFYPTIQYRVAEMYFKLGNYYDARKFYSSFYHKRAGHKELLNKAYKKVKQCAFIIRNMENPVPFNPENLGDSVNSIYDDYIDMVSVDQQRLFITRRSPVEINGRRRLEEDFYYGEKMDTVWTKVGTYKLPIDVKGNEGAVTLSPDGRYLFFSACYREDGYGSCDLYFAAKKGNSWSRASNLGPEINSRGWESQPCMSADGKTLFFVSNRPGGKGKSDIWFSILDNRGYFTDPVSLKGKVNTSGNEFAPFIHPDNQTLYFASDGHIGMGESDLFVSRRINDSLWGEPKNLGYPINTIDSDLKLIVSADGKKAYISTNREDGIGNYDIYEFDLYDEIQPGPVSYVKGFVFDSITTKPIQARFNLIDLETGKEFLASYSDPVNGEFFVCLPAGKDYALQVNKENYLFYSDHFQLQDGLPEPLHKDIPLQPLVSGTSIVLNNVFFDFDSYELKKESYIELDYVVKLLEQSPNIKIEISGHTDNRGDEKYNKELSTNRAQAVMNYLTNKGINGNRLGAKGYGASKPIAPNNSDIGRAKNRRTEMLIL
jgi:outer membrane protein OmpA-like peptidoglycan-associated protein